MKSDNALRSPGLARAFGFATALIWGLSFLSIKVAIAAIPPMTLGLLRFVIAAALLPLLAAATRESLRVEPRDLPRLLAGGLLGVTLYFLCENNGVKLLSASEASLIVGVIPVVTMLAERAFLGKSVGFRSYLGALLSFAGVGLIAARSAGASSSPLGFLYMGGAALCWVAYSFVTRPLSARYGQVSITFWQSLFGMLGFIPFAIAERPSLAGLSAPVVLNVLYLGVFCSALGYWFYVVSLDVLGAGPANSFINLIPVVSVLAAFILLGERLSGLQWAGAAAAVAGVYLATARGGAGSQGRPGEEKFHAESAKIAKGKK
jgi:drug/metabolite transporter (DMT)-like permease